MTMIYGLNAWPGQDVSSSSALRENGVYSISLPADLHALTYFEFTGQIFDLSADIQEIRIVPRNGNHRPLAV